MKILVFFAVVLHVLFLLSIFYIYFRTIIVPDLDPLKNLENPPAKRLVLIVADGLRSESFFSHIDELPFLKHTLLNRGLIGISHTHVPTESRPGHVALIAGVYEDPGAVFKGWKENPVEFDSVFNRSEITYGWGSPDILPMFSKGAIHGRVIIDTYDSSDEVFSENAQTHLLDKWVFDRVKTFLSRDDIQKLKEKDRVVLFLHLLGLDTSGHIHKPQSKKFTENLKFVDRGVGEIVDLIEKTFDDNSTAFIFTADHGMSNRGSHGAGHQLETMTPFLAFGCGVNHWKLVQHDFVTRNFITIDGIEIPRYDIQQADAAPLMSTLIGVAVPTNNFGKIPYMYPNVSKIYLANAFSNNAYQLHTKYQKLHEQSLKKTLHFSFNMRESQLEEDIQFLDEQIRLSFTLKDYDDIIVKSHEMIKLICEGIEFYQMYYKYELLIALTLAMIGWIALLYQYVTKSSLTFRINRKILISGISLMALIIGFNLLQHAPVIVIGYFVLPVLIWMIVFANNDGRILQNFFTNYNQIFVVIICIVFSEMLVFSFFERRILSLILILYTGSITTYAVRKKLEPKLKTLKYFSSAVCLGIFPLLKTVDKDNKNLILLALGTIFWIFRSMDYVYLKRSSKISVLQTVVLFLGGLFALYLVFHLEAENDLLIYQQVISWILLASPILIIFGPLNMEIKLKLIGNGFSIGYILLSTTYEPLFLLSFFVHVYSWIEMELVLRKMKQLKDYEFENVKSERRRVVDFNDIRCVLVFLLYLLVSFFGTGNMATISSFDPNWVRCFVTVFSPFLMTALIIFKLTIPIVLLACCYRAIHISLRVDAKKVFIIMLMICDIMCLNFLFLVKNKGSWLDIGISISHFIIMETTILVLILFYGLAQFLTSFQLTFKRELKLE